MRFESKNGQIKSRSNFKNFPLTVALNHQQRPGEQDSNFLYAGDEIGSGK